MAGPCGVACMNVFIASSDAHSVLVQNTRWRSRSSEVATFPSALAACRAARNDVRKKAGRNHHRRMRMRVMETTIAWMIPLPLLLIRRPCGAQDVPEPVVSFVAGVLEHPIAHVAFQRKCDRERAGPCLRVVDDGFVLQGVRVRSGEALDDVQGIAVIDRAAVGADAGPAVEARRV